jgi:hypothetical protein
MFNANLNFGVGYATKLNIKFCMKRQHQSQFIDATHDLYKERHEMSMPLAPSTPILAGDGAPLLKTSE